jgi:limonene-1,2-epoxide hydrolase
MTTEPTDNASRDNTTVVHTFFSAFIRRDYQTMQLAYRDDATFSDNVFGTLNAKETKAMWQMLIEKGTDLKVNYGYVKAREGGIVTCEWTAEYSFGKNRRPVVNRIRTYMEIEDDKIVKHRDRFDVHRWAKQAIGTPGLLFGWMLFFQQGIRKKALASLYAYMKEKAL